MPTKFLPEKSILATSIKPRKEPIFRQPPVIPEIVAYYSFDEVKKDACKCMTTLPSWSMQMSETAITFLLVENFVFKIKVVLTHDLQNEVFVRGMSAHHCNLPTENLFT